MVLMKVDYDICILQLKEMINTTMNTNRSGTWRNSNSTCAIAIMNTGIFPLSRFLTAKMFPESTKKSLQSWSTSSGYGIRKLKKKNAQKCPWNSAIMPDNAKQTHANQATGERTQNIHREFMYTPEVMQIHICVQHRPYYTAWINITRALLFPRTMPQCQSHPKGIAGRSCRGRPAISMRGAVITMPRCHCDSTAPWHRRNNVVPPRHRNEYPPSTNSDNNGMNPPKWRHAEGAVDLALSVLIHIPLGIYWF